ncbi:MAG: molybdopterin-dependent oxidoreductase [Bacillota bacterium]|nr:molybdopterin-dependent oxidoreductase [Bacillota bacterium]
MQLTRRNFLKYLGITAAAASVEAKIVYDFLQEKRTEAAPPVTEIRYGVCGICGMQCALKGKVVDGRLVKLEGNPLDLQSGGALCAKGNAGINLLYDPDRLKYPLLRTNPQRGIGVDPRWKKISWEEALDLAAAKIREARERFGGQSIIWIGKHAGRDLLAALGSPNDLCHQTTCDTVRDLACEVTFGSAFYIPDFAESHYIITFGWDQFGKGKNAWARGLAEALGRGRAKLVVFDPRLSPTASKAHEWIPIRPGTDHAVALAMIHVLISEKLYDQEFVRAYTVGFEQLAEAVRPYTPAWAAELSDVPSETIVRLAREFARAERAVIPLHKREALQVHPNGFALARAVLILLALTGNVEKRGGAILPRAAGLGSPKPPAPPPPLPTVARVDEAEQFPLLCPRPLSGHGVYQTIPHNILAERPYPVKVAIVHFQGLLSFPNPDLWVKALRKLDFIININIYPDEMAALSDLVLPEPTYLEKAGVSERSLMALYPQVAVSEPMVKPLYETKGVAAIKAELARRLGLSAYLAPAGKEAIQRQLEPLGVTYEEILARGGVYTPDPHFRPKDLTQLATPSGKIELYSRKLQEYGYDPLPTHKDAWLLPRPSGDAFYLTTTRSPVHRHAGTQNLRWLYEVAPENYVLINAAAAKRLGIAEGEEVVVESPSGRLTLKAKLTEGIRPDTICIPHGYGHWAPGLHLAAGKGANEGELMASLDADQTRAFDPVAGSNQDCHLLVRVRRA